MAEEKARDDWNHTSALLAMNFNLNRDPKKSKAKSPTDFNPYHTPKKGGIPITAKNFHFLKSVFVDKKR